MDTTRVRKAIKVNAHEAVEVIQSSDRIIIPLGCGEPETILEALVASKERLRNVEIVGGLMRNYKFLQPGMEESFHFRTWQCTPAIAKLVGKTVHYMPIRQGDVPYVFADTGPYPIDVAVIHVSPPDQHGFCSLGVSISHSFPTALTARTVIAEVNEQMPRVLGNCFLHTSQMDYLVESSRPPVEFPTGEEAGEVERAIAAHVVRLIPDGATLQIGIGTIPTAIIDSISNSKKRNLRIFGMGVDSIVDLVERQVINRHLGDSGLRPIVGGEFVGTKKLFDFIDNNPMVEGSPAMYCLNSPKIGTIKNFISIQSAIEIDLTGQVNVETVSGRPFSAIGGSHDFLQGAYQSDGGKSILALPSTAANGKVSRIVGSFASGSAVAHPRHSIEYVVTEYGAAHLRGKSIDERAKELISVAHPTFRAELREYSKRLLGML